MEILSKINWVDILVVILILRTSYVSLQDGLSHEIFPLIGSVCMLVFSLHFFNKIAVFLHNLGFILPMSILDLAGFIFTAVCVGVLFRLIKAVVDKIVKVSWHPLLEKFGGLLAGVVRGIVLTCTILILLTLIPLPYLQWSVVDRSLTGPYFLNIGHSIYEKTYNILPAQAKK
ncbi:MAG: CvpA family protein [Candidatus Omnitrophica bacterium]|nr:CvpA family protein [Candidatus Omnitrophota bacterium]